MSRGQSAEQAILDQWDSALRSLKVLVLVLVRGWSRWQREKQGGQQG